VTTRSQTRLILSPQASDAIWTRPIVTGQFDNSFLPNHFSFLNWDSLSSFFRELEIRPVKSEADFENWMRDLSALEAQVAEAFQHKDVLQGLSPELSVTNTFSRNVEYHEIVWDTALQGLYERLCEMPWLEQSDTIDRRRLLAFMRARVENYSWATYSLTNQEDRLVERFEKSLTALETEMWEDSTASWSDSKLWKFRMQRLVSEKPKLEALLGEIIATRNEIASTKHHDSYITSALLAQDSIDYSAQDVIKISSAVLESFGPLADACLKTYAKNEGIRVIRPWDDVSSEDLSYKECFAKEQPLEQELLAFLQNFHPEAARLFLHHKDRFILDLYERPEKQDSSFFSYYGRLQKGLLSTNLNGSAISLSELFHEITHLLERVAASEKQPYFYYHHAPAELSEGLALGMELIATSAYERFFSRRVAPAARTGILQEGVIQLVELARDTLFECSLYTDGVEGCGKRWLELHQRAFPSIDWRGLEAFRDVAYLDLFDDFASPLNSINYLFGKLAAFQLYSNYRRDPTSTAQQILTTMYAGDSLPLPELHTLAGIDFPTEPGVVERVASQVKTMLHIR
jgi:oligoendopeptidase F